MNSIVNNTSNIIILCQARTGSELLCDIINTVFGYSNIKEFFTYPYYGSKPDLYPFMPLHWYNDNIKSALFQKFNIEHGDYYKLVCSINSDPASSLEILDDIIPTPKVIKILHDQLKDFESIISTQYSKYILLKRKCVLSQYVSLHTALKNNIWSNVSFEPIQVNINRDNFIRFRDNSIHWYNKTEELLKKYNRDYIRVQYEDELDIIDHHPIIEKLGGWLQYDPNTIDYSHTFKKMNGGSLRDKIANYSEVEDLLID